MWLLIAYTNCKNGDKSPKNGFTSESERDNETEKEINEHQTFRRDEEKNNLIKYLEEIFI